MDSTGLGVQSVGVTRSHVKCPVAVVPRPDWPSDAATLLFMPFQPTVLGSASSLFTYLNRGARQVGTRERRFL